MSALGKIAAILGVKPKNKYDVSQYDTSGLKPVGVPEDNIGAPPPMAVKPTSETLPIQTIGGTTADAPQYDASRFDMKGMKPVGTPEDYQATPQPVPAQPMAVRPKSPVDEQINTILNKDYSIRKDPETGEVIRGKDRDKKWSLGEKIGSAIMGAFNGDGAVNAAMNRNYFEQYKDRQDLRRLAPMQKLQQQNTQVQQEQQQRDLQNDYLAVKPQIEQQKVDATTLKAQVDAEYKNNVITLGKQKADNIKAYREQIVDLKSRGLDQNDSRIQQLQQRIDEEIRHNKAGEDQAAQNEEGRNTRQGNQQNFTAQQNAIKRQMALTVKQYEEAMKMSRQKDAQAFKAQLAELKAKYDGLQ